MNDPALFAGILPAKISPRDFLTLDKLDLDTAAEYQAAVVFDVGERLAEEREELEELKQDLTEIEATLSRDIRLNPGQYGLDKVTEAAVKTAIPEQKEYVKCAKEIAAVKTRVERMIQTLASLHGQQYFAAPVADEESTRATKQAAETQRTQTRSKKTTERRKNRRNE
jgi:hypothetical protein